MSERGLTASGRLSKGDQTRIRILNEALRQGTIRGFAAVSLADVAAATQMSKSAVFKHFGAKDALQMAVLEYLVEVFIEQVWRPASSLPPGRGRLDIIFRNWIGFVDGEVGGGGCGLVQAQIEFDDQPGPLQGLLRAQLRRWDTALRREFHALCPEASSPEIAQAAFDLRSIILGYNQSHRLLKEPTARRRAEVAYTRLLDRVANSDGFRTQAGARRCVRGLLALRGA